MATTRQGFAQKVIERLPDFEADLGLIQHAYPQHLNNIEGLVDIFVAEGGNAARNPANTTLKMPGSTPLPGNTAGVQEYTSMDQGIEATCRTLLSNKGATYAGILTSLRNAWTPQVLIARWVASPWGTHIEANVGGARDSVGAINNFVIAVESRWGTEAFAYVSET
jgi:hypothetical protein